MQPTGGDSSAVSPFSQRASDRLATAGRVAVVWVVALLLVTSASLVFVTPVGGSPTHAPTVAGGGDVAGCLVIDGPGTYRLTGPVTDSAAPVCIDVRSSDVVFDGGGFAVDGVSAPGSVGIRAGGSAGALTNVTVRNVVVTEWADGLRYDDADASGVESARFERNGNGTVLVDASDAVVRDVDVVDAAVRGVSIERTSAPGVDGDSRLSDVRITGTASGFAVRSALPRNTLENVAADGVVVLDGEENVLSSVSARGFDLSGGGHRLADVSATSRGIALGDELALGGSTSDNYLTNITVVGADGTAIDFEAGVGATGGNNTVRDAVITDSRAGVELFNAPNSTLANVTVTDGRFGILVRNVVDDGEGATLRDVTVAGIDEWGVRVQQGGNNTFADVSVSDTGGYGFWIDSGDNALTNVSVLRAGEDGIYVAPAVGSSVDRNAFRGVTVSESGRSGIFTQAGDGYAFVDVTATDNAEYGVRTARNPNASFAGVTASGNGVGGLFIQNGDGQTARDLTVSDNQFGFAASGSDDVAVERLTALNNSGVADAVIVGGTNASVTDLRLSSATLSFVGSGFGFNGVDSPPAPPADRLAVGSSFETVAFGAAPTADVAVAYDEGDLASAGTAESTLALSGYDEGLTAWSDLPGSSTDTAENVVRATIAEAGVFGVFGDPVADEVEVVLDVKPGSDVNPINPRSRGVTPVAILATDAYDVREIDADSLRFGAPGVVAAGGGAAPAHGGHLEDVDGDGDADLVVRFRTPAAGFAPGDTEAAVAGEFADGTALAGTDAVRTVGHGSAGSPGQGPDERPERPGR